MVKASGNRLIRAVHAARKAAGMDDDTYRAMLSRITGKSSSKDLSDSELRRVLDHINGNKPGQRRFAPPRTNSPTAGKVRALWISLHALGGISDPSEHALNAWVKRQYHVDNLAWLPPAKSFAVIEGLKQWCARLGVNWSEHADPRLCVIERQFSLYQEKHGAPPTLRLRHFPNSVWTISHFDAALIANQYGRDLDWLIAELGAILRGENA